MDYDMRVTLFWFILLLFTSIENISLTYFQASKHFCSSSFETPYPALSKICNKISWKGTIK
jgi:hypothetical protein